MSLVISGPSNIARSHSLDGVAKFIYVILIFNILVDVFSLFFDKGGISAIVRALTIYSFVIYIIINYYRKNSVCSYIYFYIIYSFLLVFFSSSFYISFRVYLQICASLLMYPLGFYLIKTIVHLKKLTKPIIIIMVIMIINAIICSVSGIGGSYGNEQILAAGSLSGHSFNSSVYVLLLLPLLMGFTNNIQKNAIYMILGLVLFVMLVLNLTRIAILAVLAGFLIEIFFWPRKRKILLPLFIIGIILVIVYYNYANIIHDQINIRAERFTAVSYKTEMRYLETVSIWKGLLSFENPLNSFFGTEFMNSVGNYADGSFGPRQIHIDYNLIAHGSGLFGLTIYLLIYYKAFVFYKKNNKFLPPYYTYQILKPIYLALLIVPLILSISGQMYAITFRSFSFLFLGAIAGIINNMKKEMLFEL